MARPTRSFFLARLLMLILAACLMTGGGKPARAQAPTQRRDVTVNGKRVKTIDIHAHCAVPEALALMNRHLSADVETVFMMPSEKYTYVSSRLIKEVAALGGSVSGLVPALVESRLATRRTAAKSYRT